MKQSAVSGPLDPQPHLPGDLHARTVVNEAHHLYVGFLHCAS